LGTGREKAWKNLLAGECGIDKITQFDSSNHPVHIAAEVKDFEAEKFIEKKEMKKIARFSQFAIAASKEALEDAKLEITEENADRIGTIIGSGIGGLDVIEQEVEKLVLEDDKLIGCKLDIARPGEKTRITPVKDVIEPRVKVSGGEIFPGVIGKVSPTVGSGRTHALDGCCVVTVGRIVGFQEGVIDMSGPAADYCPFSGTVNLCVVIEPKEGLETHVYEKAGRIAGLKVAAYLGEAARNLEPDTLETFETKPIFEQAAMYPDLPKIGYVHMLQSQGLLHDTYYYGVDAKQFVPTFMYPTEIMDGAIVSGNCVAPCD